MMVNIQKQYLYLGNLFVATATLNGVKKWRRRRQIMKCLPKPFSLLVTLTLLAKTLPSEAFCSFAPSRDTISQTDKQSEDTDNVRDIVNEQKI
jgi:hypothetical protein